MQYCDPVNSTTCYELADRSNVTGIKYYRCPTFPWIIAVDTTKNYPSYSLYSPAGNDEKPKGNDYKPPHKTFHQRW